MLPYRLFNITCLLLAIFVLTGCASSTILGEFRHTSYHCSDFDNNERCYYLVTPNRVVQARDEPPKRTLPPQPRGDHAIMVLHPAMATPGMLEWLTDFGEEAVEHGYTLAFPEGIGRTWNDGRGGRTTISEWISADDAGWVREVISELQQYGIHKVTLMGMSSGGMLAMNMFCNRESIPQQSQLTGLITVVSNLPGRDRLSCMPASPVPVFMVYGKRDYILPNEGGSVLYSEGLFGYIASALETEQTFARAMNCEETPQITRQDSDNNGLAKVEFRYGNCDMGASITSIHLEDAAHIWPGEPGWTSWLTLRGWPTNEMKANRELLEWLGLNINSPHHPDPAHHPGQEAAR